MMNEDLVGIYLDRPVLLQYSRTIGELTIKDLAHAVVLIWLDKESWESEDLKRLFKLLATRNVLALVVAGERYDEAFSILLETLSKLPMSRHIMTRVIEDTAVRDPVEDSPIVKDAVKDFLTATWPDEDRFDDWTEYRVIIFGRSDLARQIRCSLIDVLGQSEGSQQ